MAQSVVKTRLIPGVEKSLGCVEQSETPGLLEAVYRLTGLFSGFYGKCRSRYICCPSQETASAYWLIRLNCCQDWFVSPWSRLQHEKQQHAASNVWYEPDAESQVAGVYRPHQEQYVGWTGIAVCAGQ